MAEWHRIARFEGEQPMISIRKAVVAATALVALSSASGRAQTPAAAPPIELRKGDRIVLVGNTLAERMQLFNHFETLLHARFADLQLVVRNLGWSGDTVTLQPRPLNFGDATTHLTKQKADVILAFFGSNESFAGEAGLAQFEKELDAYLGKHLEARYNGREAPRVALVSPIAHERMPRLVHVDTVVRNRELERYTNAMRRVAAARGVAFVDLFTPTKRLMDAATSPLTINGIHVNEMGDRVVAALLIAELGFAGRTTTEAAGAKLETLEALRGLVREKNQQFFYRWRPLNAEYVVGRRVEPFGSVNFPPEMKKLDEMVNDLDKQIWNRAQKAQGLRYPDTGITQSASREGRD
jgi:lysophospholipase L1-like esterase